MKKFLKPLRPNEGQRMAKERLPRLDLHCVKKRFLTQITHNTYTNYITNPWKIKEIICGLKKSRARFKLNHLRVTIPFLKGPSKFRLRFMKQSAAGNNRAERFSLIGQEQKYGTTSF